MSQTIAEASVLFRPDFADFPNEVTSGVNKALGAVRGTVKSNLSGVEGDFAKAGQKAGQSFGEGVTRDATGRLRDARGKFVSEGGAAGEAFGDGFTRDAAGRLRDGRGRFVKEGESSGEGFSKGFGDSSVSFFDKIKDKFKFDGKKNGDEFGRDFGSGAESSLGPALKRIGGLLAAAFAGGAVINLGKNFLNTAADFQQGLSQIAAVSGGTQQQLEAIHDTALRIGKDTVFSATQAASAMEELAKAGVPVKAILEGAADATVALAAAGGVDLPTAANIASNALNAFNIKATDMARIANVITGAVNASAIDMNQFGLALQQSGAVANTVGLSFDDLATAIAIMGQAGIVGSDAGTSLKQMLLNLQPQTKQQATLFKKLGIITKQGANQFFDARGKIKSFAQISGVLKEALKDQTQQQKLSTLEMLFGTDAIRAAAIATDEGAEGFNAMSKAMQGFSAADVAAKRTDNFRGAMQRLSGSWETFKITIAEDKLTPLSRLLDFVGNEVDKLTDGLNEGGLLGALKVVKQEVTEGFNAALDLAGESLDNLLVAALSLGGPVGVGVGLAITHITSLRKAIDGAAKDFQAGFSAPKTNSSGGEAKKQLSFFEQLGAASKRTVENIGKEFGDLSKDGGPISQLKYAFKDIAKGNFGSAGADFGAAFSVSPKTQLGLLNFGLSLEDLAQTAERKAPKIGSALAQIGKGNFAEGINQLANQVFPSLNGQLGLTSIAMRQDVTASAKNTSSGINDLTKAAAEAGQKIPGYLGPQVFKPFVEGLKGFKTAGTGPIQEVSNTLGQFAVTLVSKVGPAITEVGRFFTEKFAQIGAFVKEIMPDVEEAVTHVLNAIGIATQIVLGAVKLVWDVIGNDILHIVQDVFGTIKEVINAALDFIMNVIRFALAVINGDWGKAWDALKGIVGAVWDAIFAIVRGAIKIIRDLFIGAYHILFEAGKTAVTGIIDSFAEVGKGMFNIGKDLIQGLIDGAGSLLSKLGEFFLDKVPGFIKEPFKKALGISSPSKVFMEYGKNITDGLIAGVKKYQPDVDAAVNGLGMSVSGNMSSGLANNMGNKTTTIHNSFALAYSGVQSVADIQEQFRRMERLTPPVIA